MNWDAVIAICTGAAAIFTAVMAWYTRCSIAVSQKQHRDAHKQSEQHHRDDFRPVLVLKPHDGVDPLDRGALLRAENNAGTDGSHVFVINAALHNVGVGPALNIRLTLRVMGIEGYGTSRELAPAQAGEMRGDREHPLRIPLWLHEGFNAAYFQGATNPIWTLVL